MKDKWKIFSVILIAFLLIAITLITLKKETKEIKENNIQKIYLGYNEQFKDKAYADIVEEIETLKEKTKNEEIKEDLEKILIDSENNLVKIDNFNRKSAVSDFVSLFKEIGQDLEDPSIKPQKSIKNRLELLNKDSTDMQNVLNEKAIEKIYLSEEFGKDKFNRRFAASSLLVYYDIITGNGNENISPIIENYDDLVYLDARFMTAHIPLDLFVGGSTGISFEMQYVDGLWKLNPYTAMQSLNLMSILRGENLE